MRILFLFLIPTTILLGACDAAKDVIDYAATRAAKPETTNEDTPVAVPPATSPEAQAEWDRLCDPSRYAEQVSSQVHMAKYCAEQNNKDIWVAKVWPALRQKKEKEAEAERVAEAKRVAAEAEAKRVAAVAEAARVAEAQKKVLDSLYRKYSDAVDKIRELRALLAKKKADGIGYIIVPSKPRDTYYLRLRKARRFYEVRLWSEKEKIKRDIVAATKNADVALENYCEVEGALSALCG